MLSISNDRPRIQLKAPTKTIVTSNERNRIEPETYIQPSTPPSIIKWIDPRILNLSYSSLLTLHSCPRKFQLYRLSGVEVSQEDLDSSITFSYGHCVGLGIQLILEGVSYDEIMWRLFLEWKPELWADNPKQNKSFAAAVFAVQKFKAMCEAGYLSDYELLYYEGKPATELSFLVTLPGGFKLRGSVDAVLRHRVTGAILVVECKTSSATWINSATYKNSSQAIGYSIVLDVIAPEYSSYEVLYIVYSTKSYNYEEFPMTKKFVQRARWIQELSLDTKAIGMYESESLYPMRGESCVSFGRECKYLGTCHLSTENLTRPWSSEIDKQMIEDEKKWQIRVSLDDIIDAQLKKSGLTSQTTSNTMEIL